METVLVEMNRHSTLPAGVIAAATELKKWLNDQAKLGISSLHGSDYKQSISSRKARMIDAKALGLAELLDELNEALSLPDWERPVLVRLAGLHSLTNAIIHSASLPADIALLVRYAVDPYYHQSRNSKKGVSEYWIVLGKTENTRLKVTTHKLYLWCYSKKKLAVYAHRTTVNQPLPYPEICIAGAIIKAEIHYLPGINNLNCNISNIAPQKKYTILKNAKWPLALHKEFNEIVTVTPWVYHHPIILSAATLTYRSEKLGFSTQEGHQYDISQTYAHSEHLAAICGPEECWVFGLYDGASIHPISVSTATMNYHSEPLRYE